MYINVCFFSYLQWYVQFLYMQSFISPLLPFEFTAQRSEFSFFKMADGSSKWKRPCLKGRLNTDNSPQNFWTTFLENDLTEKFKKSTVANAIAIPLPLCFSCFVPLRRFRENLTKPFYIYLSRTCDSPGDMPSVISLALRLCETPAPDPVGIENCKQLFSPLLAYTTQKIATHSTDIISAARVAFFWVVNATRNQKSCLQFLIPTAVFHMLLTRYTASS